MEAPTSGLADEGMDRDVLTALAEATRPIPYSEVARRSGWHGGAARDSVTRMVSFGWVAAAKGGYIVTEAGRAAIGED